MDKTVNIIGAGLAGSEAAWQIASRGIKVNLFEMKPVRFSDAHKNENFAELVCSNSFRSSDFEVSAIGLLHEELRKSNSLILRIADETQIPAGGALAVDRELFSKRITEEIRNHPLIEISNKEITSIPIDEITIVATGPLTSNELANDILKYIGDETLSFYDAIAPIIYKDSVDFSKAWYQSRYDKGEAKDYINCPMNKEEYDNFLEALLSAEKVEFKEWEKPKYFDGCLPIEVMAERGPQTLVFGPLKPVGLTNPHSIEKPYAVLQLRQDNKEDTLRNMVGFQTKMKYADQKRVFRMIPGLENAEFAKLGGIHKNTFIKSPLLLDEFLRLKSSKNIRFAGQITGCEGYIESAAIGLLSGYFTAMEILDKKTYLPPRTTAIGSLYSFLLDDTNIENYQPSNINFGLFPEVDARIAKNGKMIKARGSDRKKLYTSRALTDIDEWTYKINAE